YLMNVAAVVVLAILGVAIIFGVQSKHGTHNTTSFLNPMARAEDRAAQSDLRNALVAEKTYYTDQQAYSDDVSTMKQIETSLDWGGKLTVIVGKATTDGDMVCMSELSKSGTTFSIADVATGSAAGTYFGRSACHPGATALQLSQLGI